MNAYISTSCFPNTTLFDNINICSEITEGFVELSAPHPFIEIKNIIKMLLNFKKKNINFTLHNYFPPQKEDFILNFSTSIPKNKNLNKKLIEESLEICKQISSPVYGVHPGYLYESSKKNENGLFLFESKKKTEKNALLNSISAIREYPNKFYKNGTLFLVENLFPQKNNLTSLFCSLNQINEYMNIVPKNTGILLDLGHLNIASNIYKFNKFEFIDNFLKEYSSRLFEIHISSNNGFEDQHKIPDEKDWQFKAIEKILTKTDKNNLIFCLESRSNNIFKLKECIKQINTIIS